VCSRVAVRPRPLDVGRCWITRHCRDYQRQGRQLPVFWVPRRKLWVIQGMLVGSASPDGRVNCASAKRIAVKPCAFGAPLRGCGA
jgi:hypothetical protein